ncbi:hypothetical protein [Thioalkalivibrio sp. HK1]|uniref:hypothetical protein n=1 Tax=Thioalkalivibrio sp. HK1 TaxID=1469245 RepID=UPI00046E6F1A|nr:hypothetical protein [Thioalkalivibrio sp. HK1]
MHPKPASGIGRIGLRALYAICAGLFLIDFIYHRHDVHPLSQWSGFYVFYGIGACIVLVFTANIMRKALMRKEDYYEVDTPEEDASKIDRSKGDETR